MKLQVIDSNAMNKQPPVVGKSMRRKTLSARASSSAAPFTPRFYYKGNRPRQLRAFCTIAKLGTMSRAAEALFLSQTAVSLQLTALEKELGVGLIERGRRRAVLTREGQVLYDLALPLVDALDELDQRFRALTADIGGGELNIAAGTSTIQYLLPPLVRAFRERYPGSNSSCTMSLERTVSPCCVRIRLILRWVPCSTCRVISATSRCIRTIRC